MISERTLAEGMNAFWREVLPMLTPSFMAAFNENYVLPVTDENGFRCRPVTIDDDITDYGLVAELAFYAVRACVLRQCSLAEVRADGAERADVETRTLSALETVVRPLPDKAVVTEIDWRQAESLGNVYLNFLRDKKEVEFAPSVPGSGFLGQCKVDLSVGNSLFEVKTVTRNFAGHDLRQLFIYLALQRATGNRRWDRGGLFNPRRATYAEFSLDYIFHKLSGGLNRGQVLDKILAFLSDRSLVTDSTF